LSNEVVEPLLRCGSCGSTFTLPAALDATGKMQHSWDYFTVDCPSCQWQIWLCQDEDRPGVLEVGELSTFIARPDVWTYQTVELPAAVVFDGAGGVIYRGRKWAWPRDSTR
jgi:hypothetical protein